MYKTVDAMKSVISGLKDGRHIVIIAVELRHAIHFMQSFREMHTHSPEFGDHALEFCNATSMKYKNGGFFQVVHEGQQFNSELFKHFDTVLVDGRITAGNWESNIDPYLHNKVWAFVTL